MLTTIDQKNIIQSPFDSIKRYDQNRVEFWSARDLMKLLGYAKYERFQNAINKAKVSCSNGGEPIENHFPASGNLVTRAQGGGSVQENYNLSRYACYLIAQNGDPRKEQIASAQKYFAVKAREAEITIPKALEEIEVLKLRVKLVTMEREKAIAEQKLLDTRHYLTTALPKVVSDRILGITEVKEIEYRDRIISDNKLINDSDTINKTELCKRYGILTRNGKPDYKKLNDTLTNIRLPVII